MRKWRESSYKEHGGIFLILNIFVVSLFVLLLDIFKNNDVPVES